MREIRTSDSEGGGIETNRFSLPLSGLQGFSGRPRVKPGQARGRLCTPAFALARACTDLKNSGIFRGLFVVPAQATRKRGPGATR